MERDEGHARRRCVLAELKALTIEMSGRMLVDRWVVLFIEGRHPSALRASMIGSSRFCYDEA